MKKLAKTFFMTLVAFAATCAIAADLTTKIIAFASTGAVYRDGTPASSGEWFALCWSPNAEFGGMDADCVATVEGDKVLRVFKYANDGSHLLLVLDGEGETQATGNYFVFMLDTRDANGAVAAANASGKPARVNGSVVATKTNDETFDSYGVAVAADSSVGFVVADGEPARIVGIDPAAKTLTVANLNPVVKYNVVYGSTLTELKNASLSLGGQFAGRSETVTFSFSNFDNAKFFQLKAE